MAELDGSTMLDQLAAATDPTLVGLELDLYWARFGGGDPRALIQRYAGRVPLLHIKDMSADEPRRDVPVGDGILPWPRLLTAGRAAGAEWYIIEQDNPQQPLADVERSLRNLEGLLAQ
jgi:sugar phosphate isomerase/epimerase